jgi:hypothetical protein
MHCWVHHIILVVIQPIAYIVPTVPLQGYPIAYNIPVSVNTTSYQLRLHFAEQVHSFCRTVPFCVTIVYAPFLMVSLFFHFIYLTKHFHINSYLRVFDV